MLSCVTPSSPFAVATAVVPESDHTFIGELDSAWGSLVGIHGGYQVALAVNAATLHEPRRPVRTIATTFLRPGQPGAVRLTIEEIRRGRSLSTSSIDLRQGDGLLNTTRITLADHRNGPAWAQPAPVIRPMAECVAIDPPPGVNHFVHAEAFIDPDFIPFTHGDRALVQGYFRPVAGQPIDAPWLAMATDWFPPPAFVRIDPPAGGISVDLTTHIHATLPPLGPDDWLTASFEAVTSRDGIALERGWIAAPDGTVLAESFHTRWIG